MTQIDSLEFSPEFWFLFTKLPDKHFVRLKFKICGFCVKYDTRVKHNNTTPFSLNNYLLKCVPNAFSTKNLSIHSKIRIGLEDQFDLHNLLQYFYKNKNCKLRLIFLLIIFGKG